MALPQPLAPGREITLKTIYSGAIELTAQRLEGVGSPGDLAHHSEWDQVSADFIGLRGFGDVLWYPASSVPVALGDGARLFTEIGRQKLRQTAARVSMRVVAEFFDEGPSVAVLDGHVVPITRTASPEASFPGVVTCSLPATALGFASPSLFCWPAPSRNRATYRFIRVLRTRQTPRPTSPPPPAPGPWRLSGWVANPASPSS